MKTEKTISSSQLQLYSLPIFFICSVLMFVIYHFQFTKTDIVKETLFLLSTYGYWNILFIFLTVIFSIILHELIHGITFSFYCKRKFQSIKFGIIWKSLMPYCNCQEELKVKHYRIGAIMPFLILGILPLVLSIFLKSLILFFYSYFLIIAATGDLIIFFLLLKESSSTLILDHPSKIGYIKIEN